ncbi:unnamed protein product [Arabis nemorensis]|uniref:PGG domain-containing protein n=1 Tax=Arabis nemorensis TaxID=586526 RepID=A0A565CQF3_9BRAS|nr:unnamed protein product [Arabis nemorensis]
MAQRKMARLPRLVEKNMSMFKETYEGTSLHLATQLGDEVDAKKIIELFPSLVSSTNSKGDTPLHLAAILGHTNILILMLESTNPLRNKNLYDSKVEEMMNKDGLTPLHCAAVKGSFFFRLGHTWKEGNCLSFSCETQEEGSLHFHGKECRVRPASLPVRCRGKHCAPCCRLRRLCCPVDLVHKDDENFLELSTFLMCIREIVIQHPSSRREMGSFEVQVVDELERQKEILRVQSRDNPKKPFEMQLEAMQSARNTLTIVGVLIASVTFTCGINPPGGVHQSGDSIGKSTVARTLAFIIFSISNTIALFTSVCMVILLLSIIAYREESLMKFLVIAHCMMWVAVSAMGSAYVSAASVTLPHCGKTIWLLCAIIAIAILTLGGMFVYLRFKLDKCILRKDKFLQCLSSQPVRKNGSVEMAANFIKGYYNYN